MSSSCHGSNPTYVATGTEGVGSRNSDGEASRRSEPTQAGTVAIQQDLDDVDSTDGWIERGGQTSQPGRLRLVDSRRPRSSRRRSDRLDLDHDPLASSLGEDVDLAATDLEVPTEDAGAAPFQEACCDALTESAQLATGPIDPSCDHIVGAGSSSSMLTSRNVRTRTLFTNRAGRYMSQTQASTKVSSK